MKKWKKLTAAFLAVNYMGVYEATPVFDVKAALLSAAGYLEKDGRFFCNAVRLSPRNIVSANHCDETHLSDVKFVQYDSDKKERRFDYLAERNVFPRQVYKADWEVEFLLNDRIQYSLNKVEAESNYQNLGTVSLYDLPWVGHEEYSDIEQVDVISFTLRPFNYSSRPRKVYQECNLYRHKDYKDVTVSNCRIERGDSGSGLYYDQGQLGVYLISVLSGKIRLPEFSETNPFWRLYNDLTGEKSYWWAIYTPIEDIGTSSPNKIVQTDQCLRVVSESGLNLRYGPSASEYDKNGIAIPFNGLVKVISEHNDMWTKVETGDGREGYVASRYTSGPFSCRF